MVFLRVVVFLAAVVAAGAGCFSPSQPPCAFSCAADGDCPSGYTCEADGVCHHEGDQGTCNIPPQNDAAQDTGSDDAGADSP
jgi:hypothetical protein